MIFSKRIANIVVLTAGLNVFCSAQYSSADELDPDVEKAPLWELYKKNAPMVVRIIPTQNKSLGTIRLSGNKILVGGRWCVDDDSNGWERWDGWGTMTALDEAGNMLWQTRHAKLPYNIGVDFGQPIRSQPVVDGDRVYYQSNRGEVVCLDLNGFHDSENDGPKTNEMFTGNTAADYVWLLDMPKEMGIYWRDHGDVGNPHPTPVVFGDLVYCVTGHGKSCFAPESDPIPPSFLAVNKMTGKVAWSSNAPGKNIQWAQWSSPVIARVRGNDQVIFPGGDGFLYGFEPVTGQQLWKLDCFEPNSVKRAEYRKPHTGRCGFVARPVVSGDYLYVTPGVSPEAARREPVLAIHLAVASGQPEIVWRFDDPDFQGALTAVAVHDGMVFVTDYGNTLFAIEAASGRKLWQSRFNDDVSADLYFEPTVHNGNIYVASIGYIVVFKAAREKRCLGRYETSYPYWAPPQFRDGRMYIVGEGDPRIWVLELPSEK